jgi:hypothetical protein
MHDDGPAHRSSLRAENAGHATTGCLGYFVARAVQSM